MLTKVKAFIGYERSGKDYQCDRLVKQGWKKVSFADPLRKIAFKVIGLDFKEGMARYNDLKKTELINGQTFRNILENLGEGVREYDEDYWVTAALSEMEKSLKNVCISDMRYANEYIKVYNWCKEKNIEFKAYLCDYHSPDYNPNNKHSSTSFARYLIEDRMVHDLQEVPYDFVIDYYNNTHFNKVSSELLKKIGDLKLNGFVH